jgi:hypothetical protein
MRDLYLRLPRFYMTLTCYLALLETMLCPGYFERESKSERKITRHFQCITNARLHISFQDTGISCMQ